MGGADGQVPQYQRARANFSASLATLTLLVLEAFQMVDLEVELIWQATRWGWLKGLYVASRAVPIILLLFSAIPFGLRNPTPKVCDGVTGTAMLGVAVSIILAEAILCLRIYALSGCRRWVRIFLYLHATFVFMGALVPVSLFMKQVSWGPSEYPENPYGCYIRTTKNLFAAVSYGILLYSGLVMMGLSTYFGVRNYWEIRDSPLIKVFYRDGTFYFMILAGMAIANGLASLLLPVGYQFLLGPLQAGVHSVVVTRMVLHVKVQARIQNQASNQDGPHRRSSTASISQMRFG